MIRRKPHDRGAQQWVTITYHGPTTGPRDAVTTFHYTKEEAEEHVRSVDSAFDIRYAYIANIVEAFQAGKPGS